MNCGGKRVIVKKIIEKFLLEFFEPGAAFYSKKIVF
jgi:hypothetical protein